MQLPNNIRERLASEFRFAADKMREEKDPSRRLYFFSAMYGEAGRLLNWTWDRDLLLLHDVLQSTYQQINARLQVFAAGQDRVIPLSNDLFELLTEAADELATYVNGKEDKQKLCELLGRFAELSYVTTGNGRYLLEKGLIKL